MTRPNAHRGTDPNLHDATNAAIEHHPHPSPRQSGVTHGRRSEQATTVDRIYAAGNCAEPRALVPAATGSGVTAAVAINVRLSFEDADRAVADSRATAPASKRLCS